MTKMKAFFNIELTGLLRIATMLQQFFSKWMRHGKLVPPIQRVHPFNAHGSSPPIPTRICWTINAYVT
jgi:hypothetical protein